MTQPVARYTVDDLQRVLDRDYDGHQEQVRGVLARYGKDAWQTGALRVQMACLKLAKGDPQAVEKYIEVARGDFRDVLAWAEYPSYFKGFMAGTPEAREEAIERDWRQLQAWLHAGTFMESVTGHESSEQGPEP